ncbi:integrase [Ammoniphilus sp. CFH 90114]|nr:integrase [Ammoniphilus sp. CFH 90114]
MVKDLEGLRERTLSDHKTHFKYFQDYLERANIKLTYLDEVTPQICRGYVLFMKNKKHKWDNHQHLSEVDPVKGLSPVTINIRIRSLKAQFNFYVKEGFSPSNPWEAVPLLKTDKSEINAFSKEELAQLLRTPNKSTFVGFRDYVLMIALLDTGCRISELLSINEESVDFEDGVIYIGASKAKTRFGRPVPVSPKTIDLIKNLIKENRILEDRDNTAIFITVSGNRLTDSDARRILSTYGKKANIKHVRVSPHTMRHTFAKHYILSGGDPFTLKEILGHSTLEMTKKYISMKIDDLKHQHNQFSLMKSNAI